MQSGLTTVVRRDMESLGRGLLEVAVEAEGVKGCSPILCVEPVALEPPYQRFNSQRIVGLVPGTRSPAEVVVLPPETSPMETVEVYAGQEDILSLSWMEDLNRAIAVLPGRKAYEIAGNGQGVWVRFAVCQDELYGLRTAILGRFPEVQIRTVDEPFPPGPPAAVHELVPVPPYARTLTLLGKEGASPIGAVVQTLRDLAPDEFGFLQVVFTPAHPDHDWHYNIENLLQAEAQAARFALMGGLSADHRYDDRLPPLLEVTANEKVRIHVALYPAVIRYGVWAEEGATISHFLQGLRVATGGIRFGNRAFRVLGHEVFEAVLGPEGTDRMVRQRLTHRPGLPLTSREIATLVHLPNDRTLILFPLIRQRSGFEWKPFQIDPAEAGSVRIGDNHYAGRVIPVEIPLRERLEHTYILGATGSGKSNLQTIMALQDAEAGLGFCIVDPHGDMVDDILSRLPESRLGDLVYITFGELGRVVRWNPLAVPVPPAKIADDMTTAILGIANARGARMQHNFTMLFYVGATMGWTLNDFAEVVSRTPAGEMLRVQALEQVTNPQARRYLDHELPRFSASDLASVRNKLSRLLLDDQLGPAFRQQGNTIWPKKWMDEGKIVLINLASGVIGTEHAHFAGGLFLSLIHRSALGRASQRRTERRPFIVYVDEFQNLQTASISEMLSEGRKYGLGLVLAHQQRGQLRPELAHALGNCATRVAFYTSEEDRTHIVRAFNNMIKPEELRTFEVGQALVGCRRRIATVRVPLVAGGLLRDPREFAREYARTHYLTWDEIDEHDARTVRRPRVYDTFGSGLGGDE